MIRASRSGAVSAQRLGPSADTSTLTADVSNIAADGVAICTLTATVKDRDGVVLANVTPVLAVTGSGNTLTQFGASNAQGVATASFVSTGAAAKTASMTVGARTAASTVAVTVSAAGDVTSVTSVAPLTGDTGGARAVTITVVGASGVFSVLFGTAAATAVVVVNATTVTCVTPAHAAGAVTVTVGTKTLATAYTYVAALFESDWSTATGNGDAALRDTNKAVPWSDLSNSNGRLEVVAAAELGLPAGMTNVLRVDARGQSATCNAKDAWAVPAIGETRYYRAYLRVDIGDGQGDWDFGDSAGHHPLELYSVSRNYPCISWKFGSTDSGTVPLWFALYVPSLPEVDWQWANTYPEDPREYLSKGHVYRLEWMVHRHADTAFRVYPRIYEDSVSPTVPLYDESTMTGNSPAHYTLEAVGDGVRLGGNASITEAEAIAGLGSMRIGTNGGPFAGLVNQYFYWGGVMVRSDDWCGAY